MKPLIHIAILALSINAYSQNKPIHLQPQHTQHSLSPVHSMIKGDEGKISGLFPREKPGKHGLNELLTLIPIIDSVYTWEWDTLLYNWALESKTVDVIYDARYNPTSLTSLSWNGSAWENHLQAIFTYDAHNNQNSFLYKYWNGIAWQNTFQIILTYDANDNLTNETYQSWNGVAWVGTSQYIYTYDSHNNLLNELDQIWNTGAWQNDYQLTYTYDVNDNETSEIDQSWNGTSWDNDYQYLNTYDAGNHLLSSTGMFWTGVDWYNSSQSNFTYDGNGNLLTRIEQSWDGISWVNFFKDSYTYNASNNVTNSLTQNWNGSSWDNSYQIISTYDSNQNQIKQVNQTWSGVAWLNVSVTLGTYDEDNFPEGESTKRFDSNGVLVVGGDSTHYYTHSVVATHDLLSESETLVVYPNPNEGKFTISSKTEKSSLEVYNLLGERIYSDYNFSLQGQKEIDLTSLGKGIYFINISDGNKIANRKIVIQ